MIDLHSHVLPGVDDGARDLADSVEMARAAVADGIAVLAATPHVRDDYPTSADTMERRLAEVRAAVAAEGIPLDVVPGGEVALERIPELPAEELRRFGLGGNPSWVLLEFSYFGWPLDLEERLFRLRGHGIRGVIAHPERNAEVQANPERLERAVRGGALVQITAASLDGRLGKGSRQAAFRLLELELAHLVASDAHAPSIRQIGMRDAVRAIGDEELAHWLTEAVPRAIVDGTPLPERPEARPRRGLLGRLRR